MPIVLMKPYDSSPDLTSFSFLRTWHLGHGLGDSLENIKNIGTVLPLDMRS